MKPLDSDAFRRGAIWLPRDGSRSFATILYVDGEVISYRMVFGNDPSPHVFRHDNAVFQTRFQFKEPTT